MGSAKPAQCVQLNPAAVGSQFFTRMPGYAAEKRERQVTIPLERALNGRQGMTLLRSESLFGLLLVTLIFDDDVDAFRTRMLVG